MTTPPRGGPGWDAYEPSEAGDPAYDDPGWHPELPEAREDGRRPSRPDGYPFRDHDRYERNWPPDGPAAERWDGSGRGSGPDRPAGRHARRAPPDRDWSEPATPAPPLDPDLEYRYQPPRYDWRRDQPQDPRYPQERQRGRGDERPPYRPGEDGASRRRYPDPLRDAMAPLPASPRERQRPQPPWPGPLGEPRVHGGYDGAPGDDRAGYDNAGYDRRRSGGPDYADPRRPPAPRGAGLPPRDRSRPPQPTLALPLPGPPQAAGALGGSADIDMAATGSMSIVRSSGVMAVGTLGSRLTGFLRTIAQSYALGALGIATAYNLANTLPNVVYNLALGGILTSVIVPLIVNAAKRDADHGAGYEQRMFTLVTGALLGITLIATVLAAPLARLYSGSAVTASPGAEHLTVIFTYFFIPQIFFYGVSSLIGAILNSRGSFAAPMWTPIINNFVVIAVLGLYVAVAGLHRNPLTISPDQVGLLGLGTTLGIIAQTVALAPALRRAGFRWRPRIDFRRGEAAEIGQMGGWMFAYVAATQAAFLVTTKLAGSGQDNISGVTDYSYAWLLFQLPYAVVGISVITALLPRMSAHASEGRLSLVRSDFSSGVRLASAIVVPCSLVLAVLGPQIAEVFLAHGATHTAQAHYMGVVFAVFCLGLLPFMMFQLQLRVFYSLHDSKTPALIGFATMALNIVANLIAFALLPSTQLVAGLGVGFGLANVLGSIVAWRILSRRLGGLDGRAVGSTLARMHAASLPAALLAVLMGLVIGGFVPGTRSAALLTLVFGGGAALLVYVLFAKALQVRELKSVTRTVMSRLGR